MADEPAGRESGLRIWLRIGLALLVVVALVIVSDPWAEPDDDLLGRNSSDRGAAGPERCPPKKAGQVARAWFRGMSSGDPDRIAAVTSGGRPVPRYVIEIERGDEPRTVRMGNRATAASTVPQLAGTSGDPRSFEAVGVGRAPKAGSDTDPAGRLAGVKFKAAVGRAKWSGKVAVRCGNETAYFADFRIDVL